MLLLHKEKSVSRKAGKVTLKQSKTILLDPSRPLHLREMLKQMHLLTMGEQNGL